ncbi:MAG TPA: FtsQ-type POTRA domain-containing protein [Lacunisphaera sp.]|nr:FtsQ-type POTRA domain-containing protein [Lacunisphaera sp.]
MKTSAAPNAASAGRSWRSIRQEVSAPAMSRRGRRRQVGSWLKVGFLSVTAAAAAWGVFTVVHSWSTDRASLAAAVQSAPVRQVSLVTNGVLTHDWTTGVLALPPSISLLALDLPGLRDKVVAHGQVQSAVLTRKFPDTLVVTLQERSPVARIRASEGVGLVKELLVAKDGVVYEGLNYAPSLLATLPWLDGVRLVRSGRDYAPIAGMTDVSNLLTTAQLEAAHLYRDWLVVSLTRLDEADEIIVKARDVPQIVFSRKRDYFKQLAQLNYVIEAAKVLPDPTFQSVNLTLEGQVPVRLAGTPEELTPAPNRSQFSLPPPPSSL